MTLKASLAPFRSHITAMATGASVAALASVVAFSGLHLVKGDHDGRSLIRIGDGAAGEFSSRQDDVLLSADWRGDFAFSADGRSLALLDGRLKLVEEIGDDKFSLTLEGDGDLRDAVLSRNGEESTALGADGDQLTDAAGSLLLRLVRGSALEASDRVQRMVDAGGPAMVLGEIDELPSTYGKRKYALALAESEDLSPTEIADLASKTSVFDESYDARVVLAALADNKGLDVASAEAIIASGREIDDATEVRLLITDIADQRLDQNRRTIVLGLLAQVKEEREALRAIETLADELPSDNDAWEKLIQAASALANSDYKRRALVEILDEMPRADSLLRLWSNRSQQSMIRQIVGGQMKRFGTPENSLNFFGKFYSAGSTLLIGLLSNCFSTKNS